MTEVAFHFNVPDKLAYSCRLLRKAVAKGARVAVLAETRDVQRFDRDLWEFAPAEFLPHCIAGGATSAVQAASPIVLCDSVAAVVHDQVLLNLGQDVPAGFERFERLIELVACDAADRERSRLRWRHYTARGYSITRHDVARQVPR
ncbi:MAG: DNA polymerase III subunit chi [Burkholderiaceae bacterium]